MTRPDIAALHAVLAEMYLSMLGRGSDEPWIANEEAAVIWQHLPGLLDEIERGEKR